MKTATTTDQASDSEAAQKANAHNKSASFKTPDGTLHFCQRKGCPAPCSKPGQKHFYNVVRHPVTWTGSASDVTPFCGDAMCPGGAQPVTPAERDEEA